MLSTKNLSVGQRPSMNTEKVTTIDSGTKLGDKVVWTLLAAILIYEVLK